MIRRQLICGVFASLCLSGSLFGLDLWLAADDWLGVFVFGIGGTGFAISLIGSTNIKL